MDAAVPRRPHRPKNAGKGNPSMTVTAETRILAQGLTFLEAPRWHEGKIWCSEFYAHRVLTIDAAGKTQTIVDVPHQPSGLGWMPDGTLLVVSMLDRKLLRFSSGTCEVFADLS